MQQSRKNLYQILEVNRYATQEQIKRAYKKLAMLNHPDKNIEKEQSSVNIFRQISEAYETLSDTSKRRIYDLQCLSNYTSELQHKMSTFNFKDAQRVYQNFRQNQNNRFYSKGQDQVSSHINGKRTQTRSTNFEFPNYCQTPHIERISPSNEYLNSSSSKQRDTNSEQQTMSLNYHQHLGSNEISRAISTNIKFQNGKIIKVKRTTIKKKDGTKQIIEETMQNGNIQTKLFSLGVGEGYDLRKAVSES